MFRKLIFIYENKNNTFYLNIVKYAKHKLLLLLLLFSYKSYYRTPRIVHK